MTVVFVFKDLQDAVMSAYNAINQLKIYLSEVLQLLGSHRRTRKG